MKLKLYASIATAGFALLATHSRITAQDTARYTVLHTFKGAEGAVPYGNLTGDRDGNLYGTTIAGGDAVDATCQNSPFGSGCGVVYKIDRRGNESVVYQFRGGADGAFPATELLLDEAGNLYGTARGGGIANPDCAFVSGFRFAADDKRAISSQQHGSENRCFPSGAVWGPRVGYASDQGQWIQF